MFDVEEEETLLNCRSRDLTFSSIASELERPKRCNFSIATDAESPMSLSTSSFDFPFFSIMGSISESNFCKFWETGLFDIFGFALWSVFSRTGFDDDDFADIGR